MSENQRASESDKGDEGTDECATCGVVLVQDGLLCPSCFLEGQSHSPPDGYQRYIDLGGCEYILENELRATTPQAFANREEDNERQRTRTNP